MSWWVYILRCGDGTLYTGTAADVERRLAAHRRGRGAKYTRGRGPLAVVYREECPDQGAALRREAAIKKYRRAEKEALITDYAETVSYTHLDVYKRQDLGHTLRTLLSYLGRHKLLFLAVAVLVALRDVYKRQGFTHAAHHPVHHKSILCHKTAPFPLRCAGIYC